MAVCESGLPRSATSAAAPAMRKIQPGSVVAATSTSPGRTVASAGESTTRAGPRATPGLQPAPRSTSAPPAASTSASSVGRAMAMPWVTVRGAGARRS